MRGYKAAKDRPEHEQDIVVEKAFANALRTCFTIEPDARGFSTALIFYKRVPDAIEYLEKQGHIGHLPPDVRHSLNLMRRFYKTRDPKDEAEIFDVVTNYLTNYPA